MNKIHYMKIGVYGEKINYEIACLIENMLDEVSGVEFVFERGFYDKISNIRKIKTHKTFENNEILNDYDVLFSFGGDGTMLRAMKFVYTTEIPVFGINTGRLGFLTAIDKDSFIDNLNFILSKKYFLSSRSVLGIELDSKKGILEKEFALNEITISRKDTGSMITIKAKLNGQHLNNYWADGLIISTPTGSTGYSLSCAGPIIMPDSNNFVITPIAPHNLNVRPIIISDKDTLSLEIVGREDDYLLTLDSSAISLNNDVKLTIKKSKYSVNIAYIKDDYLNILRKKLLWGMDVRN